MAGFLLRDRRSRFHSRLLTVTLVVLPLLAGARSANAQTVTGRVIDAGSRAGTERAIVEIFDGEGASVGVALSESDGRFRAELSRAGGPFTLVVWALSYEQGMVDSLYVASSRSVDVGDVALLPAPIPIDTIRAEALADITGRDRVRQRQLTARGTFLSGALIARDAPTSLTHYLAEAAGIRVRYVQRSAHRARAEDRTRARTPFILGTPRSAQFGPLPYLHSPEAPNECMKVTINHWPMEAMGFRTVDEIPLSWIAAVEMYNTPGDIPVEGIIGLDAAFDKCGLANIWLWNSW